MKQYLKKLADRNAYTTFRSSSDYITPNVSLLTTENEMHYNPYIDPYNGHSYVEIGGLKWATMNVGANSVTDIGLYFQWGDTQGYTANQAGDGEGQKYFGVDDYIYYNDEYFTKYNETDGKITLDLTDDAVNAAWGSQWRMPTVSEFIALYEAVTTVWTDDYHGSGVAGMMCTDKTDSSKVLFFPACSHVRDTHAVEIDSCCYWSSSLNADYGDGDAYFLCLNDGNSDYIFYDQRYTGYPVRGIFVEN